jgi:hypothetical protein
VSLHFGAPALQPSQPPNLVMPMLNTPDTPLCLTLLRPAGAGLCAGGGPEARPACHPGAHRLLCRQRRRPPAVPLVSGGAASMHACKRRRRRRRRRGHFQSVAFMACRLPGITGRPAPSTSPFHLTSPHRGSCPALPCLQVCGCGHHLRRGGPQLRGCQVPVLYQSPGHAGEDGSRRVESGRGGNEEIEALGLGTGGRAAVASRSEG